MLNYTDMYCARLQTILNGRSGTQNEADSRRGLLLWLVS